MPVVSSPIALEARGIRAMEWSTDEPHVGLKSATTSARVIEGSSLWWSRGIEWRVGPGSLLLQNAGDICRDIERTEPTRCQVVVFDDDLIDARAQEYPPHFAPNDARALALHRLHDAIAARAERFALEVAIAEAVTSLVHLAHRSTESRAVHRAKQLLRDRHADVVTLADLAAHAGLDRFRLCRAFRAEVGLPPHAYLLQLRIHHAKELLRSGVRAGEVAAAVGFYDQAQLTRHFRRVVGTTPARWASSS